GECRRGMVADGCGHMHGAPAEQAQPETQVHVLHVAEKIFVETARRIPRSPPVKSRGSARREYFRSQPRGARHGHAMIAAISAATEMVGVASSIADAPIGRVDQVRAKRTLRRKGFGCP